MKLSLADLFPIALFGLFFYRARPIGHQYNKDYLSAETGRCLRGLFAICVILHHLAQRTTSGLIFHLFTEVGYLPVAMFFFLSGYGLQKSYMKSEDYRRYFLLKRIPRVLLPYLVVTFMFWLMYAVSGKLYSFKEIILAIVNGNPIVSFSWYIINILIFYIAYWLLMLIFNNHSFRMIVGACAWYVLYAVYCIKMGYGGHWYNASPVLIVGMFWALYEDRTLKILKEHYRAFFILSYALFFATFFGKYRASALLPGKGIGLLLTMASAVLFVLCMLIFTLKVQIGNRLMRSLGEISLEVYLVQGLFMAGFRNDTIYIRNEFVWILITVVGSVTLGGGLHIVMDSVLKKYRAWLDHKLTV